MAMTTKKETTNETKPEKKVPDFLKSADQDTIDDYFEYAEFYKKRLAEINKNPGQMIMPPPNPKDYILNKSFKDAARPNAKGGMINKYAKGGEVKKYMGGGSVHKNKNKKNMITTRGWGASRKT